MNIILSFIVPRRWRRAALPILAYCQDALVMILAILLALAVLPAPVVQAAEDSNVFLPLVTQPVAGSLPIIHSFTAEPATVAPGGQSILRWDVSGAEELSILPTLGTVSGNEAPINPTVTTEYTLTATNAHGSVTAKTTVTVGATSAAGALWLPYTITENEPLPTYGADAAVDNNGGMHAAYAIYIGADQGQRPASYAYCAAECAALANWTRIALGADVQDVRLALDPAGHPRLMLFGPIADPNSPWPRFQYQYAECNTVCTDVANWTLTTIATPIEPVATREDDNNHYFTIDPQGSPAFIYTDTNQNNHPGTFYLSCQANCTNAGNWVETALTTAFLLDEPSLAFSPSGQPRLAFGWFDKQDDYPKMAYMQCDNDCTNAANWQLVTFHRIHGTAQFSLAVDTNGRPRLALYTGINHTFDPDDFDLHSLYYFWCNTDCGGAGNDWSYAKIQLPLMVGGEIDLALDAQNRPRVSYLEAVGLVYTWCDANCEAAGATWGRTVVESNDSLADNYEVLPIHHCTISTWVNGHRTALALDAAGNPRIGYDANHLWSGVYVDQPWKNCQVTDVTMTRFAFFAQP